MVSRQSIAVAPVALLLLSLLVLASLAQVNANVRAATATATRLGSSTSTSSTSQHRDAVQANVTLYLQPPLYYNESFMRGFYGFCSAAVVFAVVYALAICLRLRCCSNSRRTGQLECKHNVIAAICCTLCCTAVAGLVLGLGILVGLVPQSHNFVNCDTMLSNDVHSHKHVPCHGNVTEPK